MKDKDFDKIKMETKICNKCGKTKPIWDFAKNKMCKGGRRPRCKKCVQDYKTQWRNANIDMCRNTENMYRDMVRFNYNERRKKWRKKLANKYKPIYREYSRQQRIELTDSYIVNGCLSQIGITPDIIRKHPELIEAKRIQIKIIRHTNENS